MSQNGTGDLFFWINNQVEDEELYVHQGNYVVGSSLLLLTVAYSLRGKFCKLNFDNIAIYGMTLPGRYQSWEAIIRSLQVVLKQWLYQNMDAVVSMYEDRFDLCTLQSQLIEEPSKGESEKFSWWKKLSLTKSGPVSSPLRVAVMSYICIPVKRTKELRVLTGWYASSLLPARLF